MIFLINKIIFRALYEAKLWRDILLLSAIYNKKYTNICTFVNMSVCPSEGKVLEKPVNRLGSTLHGI